MSNEMKAVLGTVVLILVGFGLGLVTKSCGDEPDTKTEIIQLLEDMEGM